MAIKMQMRRNYKLRRIATTTTNQSGGESIFPYICIAQGDYKRMQIIPVCSLLT